MGRYYHGDIEGKFWFAVQSSMAAQRFGGQVEDQTHVDFYFRSEDLDDINAEIKRIEDFLGDKKEAIDDFFKDNNGYNDEMLEAATITGEQLSLYADLKLGIQIRDCVVEKGHCYFEAEL